MKTLACILALSIVLQCEAADFSTDALALPQGAFHKPKIIKLLLSPLRSKIAKMGFMSVLLPSLAQAHDYYLDKAGNLMVHFDAWSKADPGQNTIGGVGLDILKATGEHVTWPGITKAITHLATQTPLAGGNYSITGLPAEVISKLVKAITKVASQPPTIGTIIDPKEAPRHFFDYIAKPWMEINGHYRGGVYMTLHQAKEDPFAPALGGWHYFGPPDIHATLSKLPMQGMSLWSYVLPYIVMGMLIVGIVIAWKYFSKHQRTATTAALLSAPLLFAMKAFGAGCDGPGCSQWANIKKPFMTLGSQNTNHPWVSLHEAMKDPFSPPFTYELLRPAPPPIHLHSIEGFWKIPVQIYHAWSALTLGHQIFLFVMAAIVITIVVAFFAPKERLTRMLLKKPGFESLSDQLTFIDKFGSWKLVRILKSFRGSENTMLRYVLPEISGLLKNKEDTYNRNLWMEGAEQARAKLIVPHYGNVWHEPEGAYEDGSDSYHGEFPSSIFIEAKPGYFSWEWIDVHHDKRIALDKAISRFRRTANRSS